ncbi:ATP-binding protein [Herbivorax sp. ANBcel31]|uniref:AAA family ATPase n=1 Tax=Herbivorax sp. ANBcel31 TaxID=3069754 RepID=UPI0027B35336|nr:ATP-binding protein [Herbivorax sp. ANBcel31]MDQ2087742.1 ATP-binding protein [Herbivorax sp. ANBcel31]
MKRFIDREEEMKFLNNEYNRKGSSLVVLYGRRRVGKTELSVAFSSNKNALYFLVTEESELQNKNAFKDAVANFCENELLKNSKVDSWEIIFKTLLSKTVKGKLLIIIDEFQYLGKSNPAFPSILQKIWDTFLKDKNVMLILCGSLISMMESQTLNYTSPLYGRRTGQIKLKQIPFSYYHEFFPKKNRKELIEYYAVTGGVPRYIELFCDFEDIYLAIDNNVLSKQSFLYDEPNFLLQQEVTEVGSYFSVIKSIAAGNQKLGKIAASLELKQTGLTKYLKTLIDLDILEREVPITEENPEKSKKGLYKIKDKFILFWFKFVYPNLSFIESGKKDLAMKKIKTNLVDGHISYVYEDICIEEMWNLNAKGKWDFTFDKVGRWWSGDKEIDIVAFDSNGNDIIFGECKYWEGKVGVNVLATLEEKAKSVEWKREKRRQNFVLFGINGFTDELIEIAEKRGDVVLCK